MLSAVRSHQETCLKIKIMEITLVKTVSFLSHRKMIKHVKVQPAQLTLRVTCQKDTCGHGPALGRAWGLVQCFDNTQGPWRGSAPRLPVSPETRARSALEPLSAQSPPCYGQADTAFLQRKPQSSSVKWVNSKPVPNFPGFPKSGPCPNSWKSPPLQNT